MNQDCEIDLEEAQRTAIGLEMDSKGEQWQLRAPILAGCCMMVLTLLLSRISGVNLRNFEVALQTTRNLASVHTGRQRPNRTETVLMRNIKSVTGGISVHGERVKYMAHLSFERIRKQIRQYFL